jgi:cobalt-zinc-cadmium efflux system outer membrane protein
MQAAQAIANYRTAQRLAAWYEQYILPKARETVQLTQTLYGRGEVTFLSLLQAQRTLTETELAFVEAQADRWTGVVTIADLLQLQEFPPAVDAPAALGFDNFEAVPGPRAADREGRVPAPFPDEPPLQPGAANPAPIQLLPAP